MYRLILEPLDFETVLAALEHYKNDRNIDVRLRTPANVIWYHLNDKTPGWVLDLDAEASMNASRLQLRERDPLADWDNEGLTRNIGDHAEAPTLSDIMAGLLANRRRIEELGCIIQEASPPPRTPVLVPVRDENDPDKDMAP